MNSLYLILINCLPTPLYKDIEVSKPVYKPIDHQENPFSEIFYTETPHAQVTYDEVLTKPVEYDLTHVNDIEKNMKIIIEALEKSTRVTINVHLYGEMDQLIMEIRTQNAIIVSNDRKYREDKIAMEFVTSMIRTWDLELAKSKNAIYRYTETLDPFLGSTRTARDLVHLMKVADEKDSTRLGLYNRTNAIIATLEFYRGNFNSLAHVHLINFMNG